MNIKDANTEILNQLQNILNELSNEEYTFEIKLLSNNSIGKHFRHIMEFYSSLLVGISKNVVNYDNRKRENLLETDSDYAFAYIQDLKHWLSLINNDRELQLDVCFSSDQEKIISLKTTYFRELAYNIEHAIHHMAIIKIAIVTNFKHIQLPENFGIAYSTVNYQQKQCAQ